ncbi:hypothetical protein VTI74DRAFT_2733 [Chaetomium olivicolor]
MKALSWLLWPPLLQWLKFFDFRSLSQYVNIPKALDSFDANAEAPPKPIFTNSNFTNFWIIVNWNNTAPLNLNDPNINDATIKMVNSPNNIYIERDDTNNWQQQATHLTMRTIRHNDFQSSAELESLSQGFQFISVRMNARIKGSPGAVTAMFTYRPFRTPAPLPLSRKPTWRSAHAARPCTMDWTPGSSTWYVNGQLVSRITFQAPRDPAQVMFNTWSDGGSWSGDMQVGTEAYLQKRWIEMVYNNVNLRAVKQEGCKNVCSIDETTKVGTPVLMSGDQNDYYSQCL